MTPGLARKDPTHFDHEHLPSSPFDQQTTRAGPSGGRIVSGRVLILYTGGTVGMEPSGDGYRPMPGFVERLQTALQASAGDAVPAFDVLALDDPIDSANLNPVQWSQMAGALYDRWNVYTGFVVLHGTDTMAWSASALSFMLRGTDKPVIFTGSQIPLMQPRTDALANLQAALVLASQQPVREVGLCFGRQLLRGNRSCKRSGHQLDAFGSPNCPPLAELGIEIEVHTGRVLAPAERQFVFPVFDAEAVAVLTIYPGVSARVVEAMLSDPSTRGLVLRSYGVGNAPDANLALMAALDRAVQRGVVVVNTTQCATGSVVQGAYATGAALARIGVASGHDMTLEAAFAKLHMLLATEADPHAVREQIGLPFCGELTPASAADPA